jgi:hypothetical protein
MIVIPMAGLSKRFTDAGYDRPKYMLPLGGRTVFDHAIGSFSDFFKTVPFLLIGRDVAGTAGFIDRSCRALGIKDFNVAMLDQPTVGQAETVELGLRHVGIGDETALTIFNIDTFRPGFSFPDEPWAGRSDGYLEVFRGSGANWSYVRPSPDGSGSVLETTEKRPISEFCCTGLYHFATAGHFRMAVAQERTQPSLPELYVAPLYNHLIATGLRIHYRIIDNAQIVFCGVPTEYEALRAVEAT